MSDITVNLDSDHKRQPEGNLKHKRFVKKRHFLERKGLLNEKQNTNSHYKQGKKENPWFMQTEKRNHSHAGAVFPKFVTSQREVSSDPSRSTQGRQNCASEHTEESSVPSSSSSRGESSSSAVPRLAPGLGKPHKYVAIDCEMVGTGPKGHRSELARCSIVTYDGDVIYDKFVKPANPVTDLRTRWSGIRWQDLRSATPFKQAQRDILKILSGKVVVGHAIQNDLKVLHYSHPTDLIRDTSRIPLLNQKAGLPKESPASLKRLTKLLFNKDIQVGKKGHSSVEDAKATMELYKLVELEWERTLASKSGS